MWMGPAQCSTPYGLVKCSTPVVYRSASYRHPLYIVWGMHVQSCGRLYERSPLSWLPSYARCLCGTLEGGAYLYAWHLNFRAGLCGHDENLLVGHGRAAPPRRRRAACPTQRARFRLPHDPPPDSGSRGQQKGSTPILAAARGAPNCDRRPRSGPAGGSPMVCGCCGRVPGWRPARRNRAARQTGRASATAWERHGRRARPRPPASGRCPAGAVRAT